MQFEDVLRQQYEIAGRFLAGEWFRAWDIIPIPFFTSMDKTAGLYEKVVKNGPYSDIAPQAQLKIGEARVKEANYPEAVKAYERAADRYNDRPIVAAEALFQRDSPIRNRPPRRNTTKAWRPRPSPFSGIS